MNYRLGENEGKFNNIIEKSVAFTVVKTLKYAMGQHFNIGNFK